MPKLNESLWLSYGALALSMALVGSYVALSKPLVAVVPVFLLAWWRFGVGAVAMWHWLPKPADEPPLDGRMRVGLFFESFLGNFLFSICMLVGMSLTTATAAGVIMASMPAVVALLSRWFLSESLTRRTAVAIVLALVGMVLFSIDKAGEVPADSGRWLGVPLPLWGNLLVFGAVLCEAAYVVIGKRLAISLGPRRISALINLWGLTLMTPLGIWALHRHGIPDLSPALWGLVLFYGLAASVWTVWLWMFGLRQVDATQAGVFTVMLPLTSAAIGVGFLGERLTGLQWLAFALALAGLLVATLPGIRRTRVRSGR